MKKSRWSLAALAVVLATASAFVSKASRPYSNVYTGPMGSTTNCNAQTCQASGTRTCSASFVWSNAGCTTLETTLIHRP